MSGDAGPSTNPLRMSSASSTSSSVDKPLPRVTGNSSSSGPTTSTSTTARRVSNRLSNSYHLNGSTSAPRYPSSLARDPNRRISTGSAASSTHSRRPSRAERFEAIVDAARNVLRRGEHDLNRVSPQEWLDTCYSLLKVIDGMSKQLSTHDELAAQLKIAQSNLTLAETHSEFLEETLRRRGSTDQSAASSSLALAATHSSSSAMSKRNVLGGGGFRVSDTLKGLGLDSTGDFEPPKPSFFSRLPSAKRKNVSSVRSHQSSSSESPHLAQVSTELPKDIEGLTAEVFQLRSLVHNLEAACKNWQSGSDTLSKTNEDLVRQVVDLEKTNTDLMAELENLSMELFQEANTMVAEERKARAKAEGETANLRVELESMSAEIDRLRRELDDGGLEGVRKAEEELEKALRVKGPRISSVPLVASTSAGADASRTLENEEDDEKGAKKWYNFGRTASGKRRTPSPMLDGNAQSSAGISNPVLISSSVPHLGRQESSTPRPLPSTTLPPRPSYSPASATDAAFSPLVVTESTPLASYQGGSSPAGFSVRSDASTGAFHTPLMGHSPAPSSNQKFSPSLPSAPNMAPSLSNTSSGSMSRKMSRPTALDLQSTAKRTPQDILAEEERKNRSPMSPNDARWREKAGSLATTPVSPLMPSSATHASVRKSPAVRQQPPPEPHHHPQQQQQQPDHLSASAARKPIIRSNSYDQRPSAPTQAKVVRPGTAGSNVPSSGAAAPNSHLRINTTDLPSRRPGAQSATTGTTTAAAAMGGLNSGRLSPYQSHFSASTSIGSNLSGYSGTGSTRGKAGEDLEKLMKSIEDMNGDLFGDK